MKNNTVTVSAPGKLLLMGDHAVVYGYPCIVTAISQRLEVAISQTDDISGDRRFVDAAIRLWGGRRDVKFSIKSTFSGKYGFGSSSAVTVAVLKALKPDVSNKELFATAYKIVLDIQGVGSGFDVAAAVFGGTLYYIKNTGIDPLAIKDMPLVVGYTGEKSNTVDVVNMVSHKLKEYPEKVNRIFEAIGKLVEEAKNKMIEGDWERVGRLMDFNQDYLRDVGVSSEKLESLISAAKKAGAWGAKLSGAGGGDCMIAVAPSDKKEVISKAINDAGGMVIDVIPGEQGVRVDV